MSTDRSEYREHIIEITLSEEARGHWQGDWAVFEKDPFVAVGAGMLAAPSRSRATAQKAAWRGATTWVDAYIGRSAGHTAPSPGER